MEQNNFVIFDREGIIIQDSEDKVKNLFWLRKDYAGLKDESLIRKYDKSVEQIEEELKEVGLMDFDGELRLAQIHDSLY